MNTSCCCDLLMYSKDHGYELFTEYSPDEMEDAELDDVVQEIVLSDLHAFVSSSQFFCRVEKAIS